VYNKGMKATNTNGDKAMTSQEARNETFTRREALAIIDEHGADWDEFLVDVGSHVDYSGKDILNWLGY